MPTPMNTPGGSATTLRYGMTRTWSAGRDCRTGGSCSGNIGRGQPLTQRLVIMATLFANARGQLSRLIDSHCTSAALLADRIGLGPDVQASLGFAFERYDGGGLPAHTATRYRYRCGLLSSPTWSRCTTARTVSTARWPWLAAAAVASSTRRSSTRLPNMPTRFWPARAGDAWAAALREAPDRHQRLDDKALDALLVAFGDFVDLKCPFTLGHSRAVAGLAGDAALAAGVDAGSAALTHGRATFTTWAASVCRIKSGPSQGR